MNDKLPQRLYAFFDKLTDEERQDLYLLLCLACEILANWQEGDDGTVH